MDLFSTLPYELIDNIVSRISFRDCIAVLGTSPQNRATVFNNPTVWRTIELDGLATSKFDKLLQALYDFYLPNPARRALVKTFIVRRCDVSPHTLTNILLNFLQLCVLDLRQCNLDIEIVAGVLIKFKDSNISRPSLRTFLLPFNKVSPIRTLLHVRSLSHFISDCLQVNICQLCNLDCAPHESLSCRVCRLPVHLCAVHIPKTCPGCVICADHAPKTCPACIICPTCPRALTSQVAHGPCAGCSRHLCGAHLLACIACGGGYRTCSVTCVLASSPLSCSMPPPFGLPGVNASTDEITWQLEGCRFCKAIPENLTGRCAECTAGMTDTGWKKCEECRKLACVICASNVIECGCGRNVCTACIAVHECDEEEFLELGHWGEEEGGEVA